MKMTKIQVPKMAVAKEKKALPQMVDPGQNKRASKIPNWAEEIVAPVVGGNEFVHTELLHDQSCHAHPNSCTKNRQQNVANVRSKRFPIDRDLRIIVW